MPELTGEGSSSIGSYGLKVTDVQRQKRNFSGYKESQPLPLEAGTDSGTTHTRGK